MNLLLAGELDDEERSGWLALLRERLPSDRIETLGGPLGTADADIAIVANPAPGSLAGCTRLRLIQSLWAGVDRLLRDPTLPQAVPLARMVDPSMTQAMAETAHWAVLSLHRGYFDYAVQQRARHWVHLPQRRADEVSVLVLGHGEMGRSTAQRLADAGYRVTAWRQGRGSATVAAMPVARTVANVAVVQGRAALAPVLATAEIVVNLLPLTDATRGLIDQDFLARMRRGACLVNLARGAHVVEDDLLAALQAGTVARAVLDVFQTEPLPSAHPFWSHPKVTLLPHAAAITDRRTAAEVVVRNVEAVRAGGTAAHLVSRPHGY